MIDLPYSPLQTPLVAVEPLDLATLEDLIISETDPARRHDDWHADFPREEDLDGVGATTDLTGWSSRQVRRLADRLVVGTIGFAGPPVDETDPEVEVGFGLVEDARGQGLMAEALGAVLTLTDQVGVRVRARVPADHDVALTVLRSAGFAERTSSGGSEREVVLAREVDR